MEQLKAFGIKFIGVGIITFGVFGIFSNATITRLLLMTLVVTGIIYLGDLFILPRMNQFVAIIGDFAFYFALYWLLGNMVVGDTAFIWLPAFAAAYLATAGEAVFHIYMMDRIHEPDRGAPIPTRFQTEIAEESTPEYDTKNEKETNEK